MRTKVMSSASALVASVLFSAQWCSPPRKIPNTKHTPTACERYNKSDDECNYGDPDREDEGFDNEYGSLCDAVVSSPKITCIEYNYCNPVQIDEAHLDDPQQINDLRESCGGYFVLGVDKQGFPVTTTPFIFTLGTESFTGNVPPHYKLVELNYRHIVAGEPIDTQPEIRSLPRDFVEGRHEKQYWQLPTKGSNTDQSTGFMMSSFGGPFLDVPTRVNLYLHSADPNFGAKHLAFDLAAGHEIIDDKLRILDVRMLTETVDGFQSTFIAILFNKYFKYEDLQSVPFVVLGADDEVVVQNWHTKGNGVFGAFYGNGQGVKVEMFLKDKGDEGTGFSQELPARAADLPVTFKFSSRSQVTGQPAESPD